jgi:hypothetical protein
MKIEGDQDQDENNRIRRMSDKEGKIWEEIEEE